MFRCIYSYFGIWTTDSTCTVSGTEVFKISLLLPSTVLSLCSLVTQQISDQTTGKLTPVVLSERTPSTKSFIGNPLLIQSPRRNLSRPFGPRLCVSPLFTPEQFHRRHVSETDRVSRVHIPFILVVTLFSWPCFYVSYKWLSTLDMNYLSVLPNLTVLTLSPYPLVSQYGIGDSLIESYKMLKILKVTTFYD